MSETFTRRWRGRSKKEVSESMTVLAERKAKRMSKAERVAHGRMMAAARGHWEINPVGERVYIRHVK